MKPDTQTVTQLFELDVRYVVPLYQRSLGRGPSWERSPLVLRRTDKR